MTDPQEDNLQSILCKVQCELEAKYRKGQAEHGGNLWDRDVHEDIVAESLDLITYAYTAKFKKQQVLSCMQSALVYVEKEEARVLLEEAIEWLTSKNNK